MNRAPAILSCFVLAALAARGELVGAELDYTDACDDFVRPACGAIGGGWRTAQTNGTTAVISPSGYSTPMWDLRLFSVGNTFGNSGIRSSDGARMVGAADIPINRQTLDAWRQTLANARANGALVSPRFAYDCNGISGCEPSDFDMVLTHIAQIAEVLNEYADVVPSIECGIIGVFGEMHSSPYDDTVYAPQIIRAWLDGLDPRIQVQVRSPKYFFRLLDNCRLATNLLARQDEFDPGRRLGLFDDGYLGTIYNYGTYNGFATDGGINGFNRQHACDFLRTRAHIPYGGECAGVSSNAAAQVLDYFVSHDWNLVEEWYATHLSYLRGITGGVGEVLRSRTFHAADYAFSGMPILAEWENATLADFLRAHMGHRFVLRGSRLSATAAPGGTLALSFDVENTGFGDLFLPTTTEILLQRDADRFWACPVSIDLGSAVPSTSNATLTATLQLPSALAEGDWSVYVRTHVVVEGDSPSAAGLRTVRFANPVSQWNAAISGNLLGTVRVEGAAVAPGLGFRESGAEDSGAAAPQLILAALPENAAIHAELADWSGAALCAYAPGASNVRYLRHGEEWPSTNGVAVLPEGTDALGLWSVAYDVSGATVARDLLAVAEDASSGHVWRLETRTGRLRMVCDDCGAERDPAPGFDRGLPGRPLSSLPATNAVLTFAATANPLEPDPPCGVLYPAFTASGVPAGGANLGDLYTITAASGSDTYILSNHSGNLDDRNVASYNPARQTVAIPSDGAYLTDIACRIVNWTSSYLYGTVREFSLNNPAATRGGRSSGLEHAELATLGLFTADPRFHVWFCDEDWTVLCETNGPLAGSLAGNYHAIPIPAATNLFAGTPPGEFASTDVLCRRLLGWKRLDGAAPGWALGSVALVPDYAEAVHQWEVAERDEFGNAILLRCAVCGCERHLPGLVRWFDVRFAEDGYRLGPAWTNLVGVAADGVWERPAADATVLRETAADGRHLFLESRSAPVFYVPSSPSSTGCDLSVGGRVAVYPLASAGQLPSATSGALSFVAVPPDSPHDADGPTTAVPYGHAADGWRRLDTAAFDIGVWVEWRMELDLSSPAAPRVRYRLDDAALADGTGAEWLPLASGVDHVAGVGFLGSGLVGDFHGAYDDFGGGGGPIADPPEPVFGSTSGAPVLEFAVDPSTGDPLLVVRIANAVSGVYYTAFTSEVLDGPYAAEGDSCLATADGEFAFTIDATPDAKFIIIVAGSVFHRDGDPLP